MFQTGREKHAARTKVKINGDLVPVTISDEPEWKSQRVRIAAKKFKKIQEWVLRNREVLPEYWDSKGDMSLQKVFARLEKV